MKRLKQFLQPKKREKVCQLCSEPIGADHSHVVQLDSRRILCSCRPCYLLFTSKKTGRFRAVPDRPRRLNGFRLRPSVWERFNIPVGVAFFFFNSNQQRVMAFYPSPAGAIESTLDLGAWDEVANQNSVLKDMTPDVEALLVKRGEEGFSCYLVPVTTCYELVGRIRLRWSGLGGGNEVRREISDFFSSLDKRVEESVA